MEPDPITHYNRMLALAARDPRRAAALAGRQLAAASNPGSWHWLCAGVTLLRWERVAAARPLLDAARAAFAASAEATMVRQCDYALLLARQLAGERTPLQAAWLAFDADCRRANDQCLLAQARCEQIAHLNLLGRPTAARQLGQASQTLIDQAATPATQARFAQVLGVATADCGQLDAAASLLEHAWYRFGQLGQPVDQARVLFDRAWVWLRREQLEATEQTLHQALAVFERFDLPLRVALCWKDRGVVASSRGDFASAMSYALRARTQFANLRRNDYMARCDLNLGVVAHYNGLFELAVAAYQRAQQAYLALGDQRLYLICQRNQALVLLAQHRPAEALTLIERLEPQALALGDQLEYAELLGNRAEALGQLGRPTAALEYYQAARAIFQTQQSHAAEAECLLEAGWLHIGSQQWDAAATCLQTAWQPLANRPTHAWRVQYGLGKIAAQAGDTQRALAHYHSAGAVVATLRQQLASEHASSGIFRQAAALYTDTLRLAAHQRDPAHLLAAVEQQRALGLQRQLAHNHSTTSPALQARRDELRDTLHQLIASHAPDAAINSALRDYLAAVLYARHASPAASIGLAQPFDLAQLRQRLNHAYGSDWSVLVPLIVEEHLLLLSLTPSALVFHSEAYDQGLHELLQQAYLPDRRQFVYRDLDQQRRASGAAWQVLRALAERLLPPAIRERLHPAHRLLIVPSGHLHALPWAALRLEDCWLCEQALIELLPALGTRRTRAEHPQRQRPALLIGCQQFGRRAAELPAVTASLDVAAAHWDAGSVRLEADQATREALLHQAEAGALRAYGLIHIASHAQLSTNRGLLGHIKLADSELMIDEVVRLQLEDALVVLAACEGAAAEVLPGDEVLSLSRALLAAGASSVLASLWPTYTPGLQPILTGFYQALTSGNDPAAALALAQRALLAQPPGGNPLAAMLKTPYIWASYCVTSIGAAPYGNDTMT